METVIHELPKMTIISVAHRADLESLPQPQDHLGAPRGRRDPLCRACSTQGRRNLQPITK